MRTPLRLALAVLLLSPAFLSAAESDAEKIARLQREIDAQKIASLQKELDTLRQRIEILERTIRNQDEYLRTQSMRQAGYQGLPPSSPGNGAAAPTPTTATITVRNQYLYGATVTINGRGYRVAAGQTAEVGNVPVGTVNYEVSVDGFGVVQSLTSTTLSPRGREIKIFPR
jgi:hypothetical protein